MCKLTRVIPERSRGIPRSCRRVIPRDSSTPLRFAQNDSILSILRSEEQDPAALLATDDFLSRFHARRGRSRYFHVATGTNTVLDGDDRSVAFTVKQALELIEQIRVDLGSKRFPFGFELLLLSSQRF